jgi:integrative and conjugative element protein (TIGR02256 family)
MENEFIKLPINNSVLVQQSMLSLEKAVAFARILTTGSSGELIDCIKVTADDGGMFNTNDEILIFDLKIDVSQKVVNDIRYTERLAVHFTVHDKENPWVYALRNDFPAVSHRINTPFEKPYCLCIYEQNYDDLKLEWRSQKFLDDIRIWLALTAIGKLHQDDQPLEQLLYFNGGRIAIPTDIGEQESVFIYLASQKGNKHNFIVNTIRNQNSEFQCLILKGDPQEHGEISNPPTNLYNLYDFLLSANIDLQQQVKPVVLSSLTNSQSLSKKLLLLVLLPKTNCENSQVQNELYCFLLLDSLKLIGLNLGLILEGPDMQLGQSFPIEAPEQKLSEKIAVYTLVPEFKLSSKLATKYSLGKEIHELSQTKFCQIGTGSLGSQIFMNIAKSGIGNWKLIDEDILLPHNLVRHQLNENSVMQSKAIALSRIANRLLHDDNFSSGIWENYNDPSEPEKLEQLLQEADFILDVSTSIPVERSLANQTKLAARKISIFLNPAGSDLVILAEDTEHKNRLDILEFQYYRALIQEPELFNHLQQSHGKIRYANSCRDLTTAIPADYAAMHASIASCFLKSICNYEEAVISIWQLDENSLTVNRQDVPVAPYDSFHTHNWEIIIDTTVIKKISSARLSKLPYETGGILIGGYDFVWKKIYVVDTILSPPDSEETPTSYIRGMVGVQQRLEEINQRTAGHLKYIGEWHSHPENYHLDMSEDDIKLFKEIKAYMNESGYPPLMLIAGDNESYQVFTDLQTRHE